MFYTDPFIDKVKIEDGIRMASLADIAAMKMEVIENGGRKKDFWDIHEIIDHLSIGDLLKFHHLRKPYNSDPQVLLQQLVNFDLAEEDFDPICLHGKYWEFIKEDLELEVNRFSTNS